MARVRTSRGSPERETFSRFHSETMTKQISCSATLTKVIWRDSVKIKATLMMKICTTMKKVRVFARSSFRRTSITVTDSTTRRTRSREKTSLRTWSKTTAGRMNSITTKT